MFDNLMFSLLAITMVYIYIYTVCPLCWDMIWGVVSNRPGMGAISLVFNLILTLTLSWLIWTPVYVTMVTVAMVHAMIFMAKTEKLL